MYDDVPIVPNLYTAPENPRIKDCYYNITVDKYYIYDGTEWLEAKVEGNSLGNQDVFYLTYSLNDGITFTSVTYDNFDDLCTAVNSNPINNASNIIITTPSNPAVLVPRSNDTSLDGVALLKFKNMRPGKKDVFELKYTDPNHYSTPVVEQYNEFYALQERLSSLSNCYSIDVEMSEVEDPYTTVCNASTDIFILQYSKDGGETFIIEEYNDFEKLIEKTHSFTDMIDVTDIKVSMVEGPESTESDETIVGKIYPKIIFNQKLVENLVVNTNDTEKSIFDNVLVHYKNKPKNIKYRVSYISPGSNEWIVHEYADFSTAIASTIGLTATDFKFEEIEE